MMLAGQNKQSNGGNEKRPTLPVAKAALGCLGYTIIRLYGHAEMIFVSNQMKRKKVGWLGKLLLVRVSIVPYDGRSRRERGRAS